MMLELIYINRLDYLALRCVRDDEAKHSPLLRRFDGVEAVALARRRKLEGAKPRKKAHQGF